MENLSNCCRCGHDKNWHRKTRDNKTERLECVKTYNFGFCNCKDYKPQGDEMPAKEKKVKVARVKKVKAALKEKVVKSYKVFTSKVEASDYAKKFENKETTNHHVVVLQTLARFDNPKTLEEVIEAVKESGRYGRQKNMPKIETYIASDLRTLAELGLVGVTPA